MPEHPQHVLISFCNVTAGAPALALLDLASGAVRVPAVPRRISEVGGVAGLAVSDDYIYAVTQRSNPVGRASGELPGPSYLLIFDRADLSLRTEYRCTSVVDAHSICAVDGELYVVSTGTDEVVRLGLRGAEVVAEETFWRPEPAGPHVDLHHLNAIYRWRGELLVSAFGKKSGSQWSSATDGFIVNLCTGERLASGIYHPHSLLDLDDSLAYCESSTMTTRVLDAERSQRLPGYTRGLCRVGDALLVGTSKGRRVSKSTRALTNRGDPGVLEGRCTVARLSAASFEVQQVVDLEPFGWEVYDLAPVDQVEGWPILEETAWRDDLVRGLRESFDERDATISWLHVEVAKRDDVAAEFRAQAEQLNRDAVTQRREVERLHELAARQHRDLEQIHEEVAERDKTIEWLHGEVATQHSEIERLHREVARRDREMKRLHNEVAQRDETIKWLHGEVALRDATIGELRDELARKTGQVERARPERR